MTPAVEDFIALNAQKGHSSRAISAMLLTELGVKLSFKSVSTQMTRRRAEKTEVAKEVVRAHLTKTLVGDLVHLENERIRLGKFARKLCLRANAYLDAPARDSLSDVRDEHERARGDGDLVELYLKAVDRLAKVIDLKLKYSGAAEPDVPVNAGGPTIYIPPEDIDD